ncbi:MAG: type II toxin-antitoxin system VapC family toxin [Clostridiales bacterium]|nr:type II toxin-antitoxin system VapC family toxin [Clostridiales bacterium]
MNLLLDTHILIWALNGDSHLSEEAKDLILDEDNAIYYSSVSIWEISIKHALHPDNVSFSGKELAAFCQEACFIPVEVRDKHVFALETLSRPNDAPPHHDPFDRMLISQAKAENLTLITHDKLLADYGEKCVIVV